MAGVAVGLAWFAHPSAQAGARVAPQPSYADRGIAPDGSEIAFVSGGDIWTVPAAGGEARLLISNAANDTHPVYSPDKSKLAFVSTRTGGGDIYVLTFATGDVRRLTFDDGPEQLDGWSRDGKWIYFFSSGHDLAAMNDIYRVAAEGGTPMPVSADRCASEYFSAASPDGRTLTNGGAKEMWPMWNGDGASLFYVSDRSGAENIWQIGTAAGSAPRQVTRFTDGRLLWPSITIRGDTIVFERGMRIWKLDTASGNAAEIPITRIGAPAGPAVDHLRLSAQFQDLALSPDGRKVAFTARGEVFAASAKDGGDAARVTMTPAAESDIAWAPDSRRIVYACVAPGHLGPPGRRGRRGHRSPGTRLRSA